MRFLLDTNAISEWVKPRPDPGVVRWFDQWGHLLARAETAGKKIDGTDVLIAATALVPSLQVVTRNIARLVHRRMPRRRKFREAVILRVMGLGDG